MAKGYFQFASRIALRDDRSGTILNVSTIDSADIRNMVIRFSRSTSRFTVISPPFLPSCLSPFLLLSRICLMHKQFPRRRRRRQFPIITHLRRPDDELLSRLGQFRPELRLPHNRETPRGVLTQKPRRASSRHQDKRNGPEGCKRTERFSWMYENTIWIRTRPDSTYPVRVKSHDGNGRY